MRYLTGLFESVGLPSNYGKLSLHANMVWAHSPFRREDALKIGWNGTHWDPVLNHLILYRDKRAEEAEIERNA